MTDSTSSVVNGQVALAELVCLVNDAASDVLLSPRERQVLTQIAEGLTSKQIASHFGVGLRTIETHRDHIMQKLGVYSIAGLTRLAIVKGYVKLGGDRFAPPSQPCTSDLRPLPLALA